MHCLHPISIRNPAWRPGNNNMYIQVPCGRCIACQERRRTEWAFRMEQESRGTNAYFATLTYDDSFVPTTVDVDTGEVNLTLRPKDLQDFLKRFRKYLKVRFFACGEYGGQFGRPHFHVILFTDADYHTVNDVLSNSWKFGFTDLSPANTERFRYVAKYVVKLNFDKYQESQVKPFARMSLRPAIGAKYLDVASDWLSTTDTHFCKLTNGEPLALPRYYSDKVFTPLERLLYSYKLRDKSDLFDWMRSEHYKSTSFLRQDARDAVAWEKSKIRQFCLHYLNKY